MITTIMRPIKCYHNYDTIIVPHGIIKHGSTTGSSIYRFCQYCQLALDVQWCYIVARNFIDLDKYQGTSQF